MDPLRTYDYLLASRRRVLDAARGLTAEQYLRPFPFGLGTVGRTLTHVMVSEWYYVERLEGRAVPPYDAWPIKEESPPPFDALEAEWDRQGPRVRRAIAAERDWSRRITYVGFPDDAGRRFAVSASAGDLITQLALHEVHHRAQAMAMLRQLGRAVQDIDFNDLVFERRPVDGGP
jgi:uncharacterized damage-inducible protein DinB